MNKDELHEVLKLHKQWLNGTKGGKKADLSYVNLRNTDLRGMDLRCISFKGADLSCADLSYSNLRGADLSCADLSYTNLKSADLRRISINTKTLTTRRV